MRRKEAYQHGRTPCISLGSFQTKVKKKGARCQGGGEFTSNSCGTIWNGECLSKVRPLVAMVNSVRHMSNFEHGKCHNLRWMRSSNPRVLSAINHHARAWLRKKTFCQNDGMKTRTMFYIMIDWNKTNIISNSFQTFHYFLSLELTASHLLLADMSTLLESKEALRSRGIEVSLTAEEIDALITNRVDSLARLALAACPPGEAPTNEQTDGLFNGLVTLNPGTYASMKRLIFEAQTLLSAELQNRFTRPKIRQRQSWHLLKERIESKSKESDLKASDSKEKKSVPFQNYDLVLGMMEKGSLVYLPPEKFATRRSELALKKATKEISIDQSALVVRDKSQDITCSTATELETTNAMRRRALAFDLVQACSYLVMNAYHAELFDHLHMVPPPGYSAVTLTQILRADRAAWLHMAEKLSTLKRDQQGTCL